MKPPSMRLFLVSMWHYAPKSGSLHALGFEVCGIGLRCSRAGSGTKIESQEQRKIEHQLRETETIIQALFNGIGEGFALPSDSSNSKVRL